MAALAQRLPAGAAQGWRATFHFRLSRCAEPEWTVQLDDQGCRVAPGLHGTPGCVVEMSGETFLGIATGAVNPQVAFMLRRVKVSDLGAMMKFLKLLRPAAGSPPAPAEGELPPSPPSPSPPAAALPLAGVVVVDCSRMLPGAVLARQLLELGARLIKVEEPGGDPLRHAPPLVDGIGAGFAVFFRGAQSVELDLRTPAGAAALRALARRADVLVESFRPGTLAGWGVALADLRAANPGLVTCSLSAYGEGDDRPGHDLNVAASSGLLALLGDGVPGLLFADVSAGLLAATAIVAALLARSRSGRGTHLEQPLGRALQPFLAWPLADRAGGGEGVLATHLSGACPAYRRYRCGDGRELAVAAVEPKFWSAWVELLGLPEAAGAGLDPGEEGASVAAAVEAVLQRAPRDHWLGLATAAGLPVSPVRTLGEVCAARGQAEEEPWLAGGARPAGVSAPRLGEHTAAVLAEVACGSEI